MTNYLTNGDTITQSLGKLYRKFGYSRYKMSKFEEYDTYVENKDFLISDRVITFTDVSGKLLAMKPDVTISIIKNTDDTDGLLHKLYYKENVYRVSNGAHAFKEIMQMGLECIGLVDTYSICEVIMLAGLSLSNISDNFVLDISHMGFVSAVLKELCLTPSETNEVLNAIGEKNLPKLIKICSDKNLSTDLTNKITGLVSIYGSAYDVIDKLEDICINDEAKASLYELRMLCEVLKSTDISNKIRIDFSVVNDMNYYNGLVFRGYIEGIPTGVLSGGQYDKLMSKMGKKSKAIGFAIYLDLLEMLDIAKSDFDTDVLIIYDTSVSPVDVFLEAKKHTANGKNVLVLNSIPKNIRYKELINLCKGGKEF